MIQAHARQVTTQLLSISQNSRHYLIIYKEAAIGILTRTEINQYDIYLAVFSSEQKKLIRTSQLREPAALAYLMGVFGWLV